MDLPFETPKTHVIYCGARSELSTSLEKSFRLDSNLSLRWETQSSGLEAWQACLNSTPHLVVFEESATDLTIQDFLALTRAADLDYGIIVVGERSLERSFEPGEKRSRVRWLGAPTYDQLREEIASVIGVKPTPLVESTLTGSDPSPDVLRNPLKLEWVRLLNHEFRNPLAIAQTHLEYLQDLLTDHSDPEIQQLAERAKRSVMHLGDLVSDCQELCEWWTRRRAVRLTQCSVAECLKVASTDLGTPTRLDCRPDETGALLWADPQVITEMLKRLIENALRHGSPDEVVIVETEVTDDGNWRCSVIGGRGENFDSAEAARWVDAFEVGPVQLASGGAGGLGLGLSIVREGVAAFGGTLSLDQLPGENRSIRATIALPVLEFTASEVTSSRGIPVEA